MILLIHITELLACMVLLSSTLLLIWSIRKGGVGSLLGKFVGSLVFVLALLSMVCTAVFSVKYWARGHNFGPPAEVSREMRHKMMEKMMPLMMEKMSEVMKTMDMQKEDHNAESSH